MMMPAPVVNSAAKRFSPLFPLAGRLAAGRVPGQLVIQLTDHCNARCPQCGMRAAAPFTRHRLSLDRVRAILDAAAARGIGAVSFTGGEPFLFFDDLVALIEHAGRAGIPMIRTGTNGFWLRPGADGRLPDRVERMVARLAATPLRNLWISIDSADAATHERMRGFPNLIRGIEKALPIFHRYGIYPSANLGLNRNLAGPEFAAWQDDPAHRSNAPDYLDAFADGYRRALGQFYRFVESLGFTMVNTCYPMSVPAGPDGQGLDPVYAATAADRLVRFRRAEKAVLFAVLSETIAAWRGRLRIFTPRCALYHLQQQYAGTGAGGYGCRGGLDFFFIDARDGSTYPCGYRGRECLGDFGSHRVLFPANDCRRCDWECFRDPSELFGPLLAARRQPLRLADQFRREPEFFRLWRQDVRYYQACDWFDGRRPPHPERLKRAVRRLIP